MPSIAVGTTNPGKVAAVKRALEAYPVLHTHFTVAAHKVPSGVSEQVLGREGGREGWIEREREGEKERKKGDETERRREGEREGREGGRRECGRECEGEGEGRK